jgi:hypothetical protein
MKLTFITLFILNISQVGFTQEVHPFSEITEYPASYDAPSVAARMIDALGFRYYWATKGLSEEDLSFSPTEEIRSSKETVEHIYNLVKIVYNAHFAIVNGPVSPGSMSFSELRIETLQMLDKIKTHLITESPDLDQLKIRFPSGELPYWNLINGPMADAVYHTGQLVIMRRMSGNPIDSGVDVLMGVKREN